MKHLSVAAITLAAVMLLGCTPTASKDEPKKTDALKESIAPIESNLPTDSMSPKESIIVKESIVPIATPGKAEGPFWDKNYYAVLPIESNQVCIYDASLKECATTSVVSEWLDGAVGLYGEDDFLPNNFSFKTMSCWPVDRKYDESWEEIFEVKDGIYASVKGDGSVRLMNAKGKTVAEFMNDDADSYADSAVVWPLGDNILIYSMDWEANAIVGPYIVSDSGKIVKKLKYDKSRGHMAGTIGDYIIYSKTFDGYYASEALFDVYDVSGKLKMEDVSIAYDKLLSIGDEATFSPSMRGQYVISDGKLYNNKLKKIGNIQIGEYAKKHCMANMLFCEKGIVANCVYELNGVKGQSVDTYIGVVKTFCKDGKMTVIDGDGNKYTFPVPSSKATLSEFNKHIAVLDCNEKDMKTAYVCVDTGRKLKFSDFAWGPVGDGYAVVAERGSKEGHEKYSVINDKGKLTYTTENSVVSATKAGCIVLKRGPYVGIADINGNWITKALSSLISMDKKLQGEQ